MVNQNLPQTEYAGERRELLPFIQSEFKKVLDVGCSQGDFGAAIKKQAGSFVVGIENYPEAAAKAKMHLDQVIVGNIETLELDFPAAEFDCIVFADILEHLVNPDQVLRRYAPLLKPNGTLLISIPNVQHVSVLSNLFRGDWKYQNSGILDRTHLRFFTKKSFTRFLNDGGFEIETSAPIFSIKGSRSISCLSFGLLDNFLAAQYIFTAKRKL